MKIWQITLLIFSFTVQKAHGLESNFDSYSLSLSNANIPMNTDFNLNENLASSVNSTFNGFLVSHQSNFQVKELATNSLEFIHHLKSNSIFDVAVNHSGNSNFNETNLSLAFAKKLGDRFNAGIKLNQHLATFGDEKYSKLNYTSATIYLFVKATSKIHLGCIVDNPSRIKLNSNQNLPASLKGGISYLPANKIKLGIVAIQENGSKMHYSIGIAYQFLKEFETRVAYENQIESVSGGFSLRLKRFQLEFAFKTIANIGNRSSLSFLIPIK